VTEECVRYGKLISELNDKPMKKIILIASICLLATTSITYSADLYTVYEQAISKTKVSTKKLKLYSEYVVQLKKKITALEANNARLVQENERLLKLNASNKENTDAYIETLTKSYTAKTDELERSLAKTQGELDVFTKITPSGGKGCKALNAESAYQPYDSDV
jgi:Skp family chaperone for outer membrane proteins